MDSEKRTWCSAVLFSRNHKLHQIGSTRFLGMAEKPWSLLHLDYAGPYCGHMYPVVVDAHSKWMDVMIMQMTHDFAHRIGTNQPYTKGLLEI